MSLAHGSRQNQGCHLRSSAEASRWRSCRTRGDQGIRTRVHRFRDNRQCPAKRRAHTWWPCRRKPRLGDIFACYVKISWSWASLADTVSIGKRISINRDRSANPRRKWKHPLRGVLDKTSFYFGSNLMVTPRDPAMLRIITVAMGDHLSNVSTSILTRSLRLRLSASCGLKLFIHPKHREALQ